MVLCCCWLIKTKSIRTVEAGRNMFSFSLNLMTALDENLRDHQSCYNPFPQLFSVLLGKSGKVIRIHFLGTMNIWIKFHGNPSNSLRYFSLDKSGSQNYIYCTSLEPLLSLKKKCACMRSYFHNIFWLDIRDIRHQMSCTKFLMSGDSHILMPDKTKVLLLVKSWLI